MMMRFALQTIQDMQNVQAAGMQADDRFISCEHELQAAVEEIKEDQAKSVTLSKAPSNYTTRL